MSERRPRELRNDLSWWQALLQEIWWLPTADRQWAHDQLARARWRVNQAYTALASDPTNPTLIAAKHEAERVRAYAIGVAERLGAY